MNIKKFLIDLLYKVIPERKFEHVDVVYRLKHHTDVRNGIKELKKIAPNCMNDKKNDGLWLYCNGASIIVHKDSNVEDLVDQYHKDLDRK